MEVVFCDTKPIRIRGYIRLAEKLVYESIIADVTEEHHKVNPQ